MFDNSFLDQHYFQALKVESKPNSQASPEGKTNQKSIKIKYFCQRLPGIMY